MTLDADVQTRVLHYEDDKAEQEMGAGCEP